MVEKAARYRRQGRANVSEHAGQCLAMPAVNALISAFSEQSKSSWRFGVVPGRARCENGVRTAEADVKSSSDEKLSSRFSTACPLSVALRVRSHPDGPANCSFPGHARRPPPSQGTLLSCDI